MRQQRVTGPIGAALLVVGALGVIDRIVKPQRHGQHFGPRREDAQLAQPGQALGKVAQRVIVPLRLLVAGQQRVAQRVAVTSGTQCEPVDIPEVLQLVERQQHLRSILLISLDVLRDIHVSYPL